MKNTFKSTAVGIGIAMALFLVTGVVFDFMGHGQLVMENYAFSKMALGTVLIGIGFGLPSIVYENDRWPRLLKIVIHMGIGCAVMGGVSSWLGWYPKEHVLWALVLQFALSFLIWLGFYFYSRHLSKQMNQKIELYQQSQK